MNELTSDEQGMLVDAIHDSATVIHKGQRMNERIRELIKQATECYSNGQERTFNKEKFAELIVRECAKAADEGLAQVTMKVEWPSYHILKHFGVEESLTKGETK